MNVRARSAATQAGVPAGMVVTVVGVGGVVVTVVGVVVVGVVVDADAVALVSGAAAGLVTVWVTVRAAEPPEPPQADRARAMPSSGKARFI